MSTPDLEKIARETAENAWNDFWTTECRASVPSCFAKHILAALRSAQAEPTPFPATKGTVLDKLATDLPAIRDTASESGAGDPPAGYEELEGEPLRIADECWSAGLTCMETAIKNWIYDQRNDAKRNQQEGTNPVPEEVRRAILDAIYFRNKRVSGEPQSDRAAIDAAAGGTVK